MSDAHPFVDRPHRTFLRLSVPVLFSLIAEPLTGLIDTAFVARLGGSALAGLGVSTALLAGVFWVFNFLAIGTQTEVAHFLGARRRDAVARAAGTAFCISIVLGLSVIALLYPNLEAVARFFGAEGEVLSASVTYLRIRLLGGPAFLATQVLFGAMRGLQDMRTPLLVAVAVNVANVALDAVLIHGVGPVPAYGIAGAAWASMVSQVGGAVAATFVFHRWQGLARPTSIAEVVPLFRVGRDLVIRTGLLLFFMMDSTRVANLISVEAGAAHQAIRQVWIFAAFALDAYALTAQSLLGYFLGIGDLVMARRVAFLACAWGITTGAAASLAMVLATSSVSQLLLGAPPSTIFANAWLIAALAQPLNAVSFVTDGIHWGSGDYRYLRHAMFAASGIGIAGLLVVENSAEPTLSRVWWVIALWIAVRAGCGFGRLWPVASGPLRQPATLGSR
jgi:MATE family multidrug resistance protein